MRLGSALLVIRVSIADMKWTSLDSFLSSSSAALIYSVELDLMVLLRHSISLSIVVGWVGLYEEMCEKLII